MNSVPPPFRLKSVLTVAILCVIAGAAPLPAFRSDAPLPDWKTFYDRAGDVLVRNLGRDEEDVRAALAEIGFPSEELICESDAAPRASRTCSLRPTSARWYRMKPSDTLDSTFLLNFRDGRLLMSVHIIRFNEERASMDGETSMRDVFDRLFDKPPQRLGRWRRRITSALVPMAGIAEAWQWEGREEVAGVTRGTIGPPETEKPALVVSIRRREIR